MQHLWNWKDCTVNKIILTDVDGVLLDWEAKFDSWIQQQGYKFNPVHDSQYDINTRYGIPHGEGQAWVEKFNSSSDFESLAPWKDSVEYVKRLAAEGWQFIAITTAGDHPWTHGLRWNNLINVFGEGVFKSLHVLPIHGDKGTELAKYKDSGLYWIEDKLSNAELGTKFGLTPLLMDAPYNRDYHGAIRRVNDWKEIYSIVNA